MRLFHTKDWILVFVILITAAVSALVMIFLQNDTGQTVRVTIDGKLYGEYRLSDNQVVDIDGELGYNRLVISDCTAYIDESDCPDKYCMEYNPISKENEIIVCLPHKLVVEIDAETGID